MCSNKMKGILVYLLVSVISNLIINEAPCWKNLSSSSVSQNPALDLFFQFEIATGIQ